MPPEYSGLQSPPLTQGGHRINQASKSILSFLVATLDTNRVNHWLTLAANFGVIVGIAFLVLEIRQNSDIATAQVRLDYAAGWRAIDGQRQDEAFAEVFSRSMLSPGELSFSEVVQLDGYYTGVIDQMLSAYTASEAGLRSGQFEDVAMQVAIGYFSNEYGQAWWRQAREAWSNPGDREFQRIMDKAIGAANKRGNQEYYEGILRNLSPGAESTDK